MTTHKQRTQKADAIRAWCVRHDYLRWNGSCFRKEVWGEYRDSVKEYQLVVSGVVVRYEISKGLCVRTHGIPSYWKTLRECFISEFHYDAANDRYVWPTDSTLPSTQ